VLGTAALEDNPGMESGGFDYSREVTDGDNLSFAVLDSLGDLTNDFDAFFIKTKFKAKQFNFIIRKPNGTAGTLKMDFYDISSGWTNVTITDGTASGGAPLAIDGSVSFTPDPDEIEFYAFGENGYWYRFYMADGDSLDAEVEIQSVTYEGDFQRIENVWDGIRDNAIEIYHDDDSDGVIYRWSGAGAEIGDLAHADDLLYFSSITNLVGAHFYFGSTPNTTAATTVNQVSGWDGDSWVDTVETDGTDGFNESGFITWKRNANFQPREFKGSTYRAYWWRVDLAGGNLSSDTVVTITTMPWYDISDIGRFGTVSTTWKERAIYAFDSVPSWIFISGNSNANWLNGSDFATLQAGDGRYNKVVAMKKFHNELMVWQEEKGRDGGCITLFEGYNPSTFGRLVLSTKIGGFSQKAVVVVDGAQSYTRQDDNQQKLAFFISHYGIFVTDGRVVTLISQDIQNYFDQRFSECIRVGYENKMWCEHDTMANVIRFGLVSGDTAEVPNIFPVFDLQEWEWSFDVLGQALSVVHEVEADSGQFPILQVGGGSTTGFIYRLNHTNLDDATTIEMRTRQEFSNSAKLLEVTEAIVRMQAITDGEVIFKAYRNGVIDSDATQTINMAAEETNETLKRERIIEKVWQASHISIEFLHSKTNESCYLYDLWIDMNAVDKR
jgi:hypothetical protein